ncbi:MAG: polysaccharide deacetylase family protein, partial [Desulfocucumaceae bacterium]
MRSKIIPAAVLLCLAFALTSCSTAAQKPPEVPVRQEKVNAQSPSPERVARAAVKKEYLTVNGIEIREDVLKDTGLDVRYPQIDGLLDQKVSERINTDIKNSVEIFVGELAARHQDVIGKQTARGEGIISAGYGVHGNYNNVLSISERFNIHVGSTWEAWVKTYT